MNLFNSPSLTELNTLIGKCTDCNSVFYLGVEHDGEVLMETDSKKYQKLLRRYKFYIRCFHGKMFDGSNNANNINYINQLYKNLISCWEKNLKGRLDNDKLPGIQNLNLWHEMKKFQMLS